MGIAIIAGADVACRRSRPCAASPNEATRAALSKLSRRTIPYYATGDHRPSLIPRRIPYRDDGNGVVLEEHMRNFIPEDELEFAFKSVEVAAKALATVMRGGNTVAGMVLLPDPAAPGQYVGDVVVDLRPQDGPWFDFAAVCARVRLHRWLHDDRPLIKMDPSARETYRRELIDALESTGVDEILREGRRQDIGLLVIEVESVWAEILSTADWLAAIAVGHPGIAPTEEQLIEMVDGRTTDYCDLMKQLPDVLGWWLPD